MTDHTVNSSPKLCARIGGALYLIIIVIGLFGEAFVRDRLIVSGDAAATAANIMSHESLWRFHIAAELFLLICAVALLWILFALLRPVSKVSLYWRHSSIWYQSASKPRLRCICLRRCFHWGMPDTSKHLRQSSCTPWRPCRSNRTAMVLA